MKKTLLLLVLALCAALLLFRGVLGISCSVVLSDSMAPTLRIDDLVFIRRTKNVQKDDIIVFQEGSMLVIHRVVAVDGDTLQTRGDANNASDAPIHRDAVKGKLLFTIPGAGRVIRTLRQPWIIAGLAGTAMLLAVLSGRTDDNESAEEESR